MFWRGRLCTYSVARHMPQNVFPLPVLYNRKGQFTPCKVLGWIQKCGIEFMALHEVKVIPICFYCRNLL